MNVPARTPLHSSWMNPPWPIGTIRGGWPAWSRGRVCRALGQWSSLEGAWRARARRRVRESERTLAEGPRP